MLRHGHFIVPTSFLLPSHFIAPIGKLFFLWEVWVVSLIVSGVWGLPGQKKSGHSCVCVLGLWGGGGGIGFTRTKEEFRSWDEGTLHLL